MDPTQLPRSIRFGVGSRLPLAIAAYVLRVLLFGFTPSNPFLALIIDALVVGLSIWALVPGRDQFGPNFAKRTHWTGIFMVPVWLSTFLVIRDLVLLARDFGA